VALMKIHHCVVQTAPPTEVYPGQVAEGRYTWEDGVVTLVSPAGVPLTDRKGKPYEKKLTDGEDPYVIGRRLTKQRHHDYNGSKSDFWRPLTYKTINY
jgi:hypothetical protein